MELPLGALTTFIDAISAENSSVEGDAKIIETIVTGWKDCDKETQRQLKEKILEILKVLQVD